MIVNRFFRRTKKRLSLWLLIAMIAHFTLGHDALAFVLCFGSDGHVAVEKADHDHSLTEQGLKMELSHPEQLAYTQNTWINNCLDIPIIGEGIGDHKPANKSQERVHDSEPIKFVAFLITLIPAPSPSYGLAALPNLPAADSRLKALRSVVLLN